MDTLIPENIIVAERENNAMEISFIVNDEKFSFLLGKKSSIKLFYFLKDKIIKEEKEKIDMSCGRTIH